jgi:hypothetical protein
MGLKGMRRNCHKPKPRPQRRDRSRHCYYWGVAACNPQRVRSRFSQLGADPCLGARRRRRERAPSLPGY